MIILDNGLNKKSKNRIHSLYKNVSYRTPDVEKYSKIDLSITIKELSATYFKLDIFAFTEYDRIVFIDSDVLVLGDISELFSFSKGDMGACSTYRRKTDSLEGTINSGVMVLNKPVINNGVYDSLVEEAQKGFSLPDQETINNIIGPRIVRLDKKYNMEKRMYKSKKFNWKDAVILHYVSHKPWYKHPPCGRDRGFDELHDLWRFWYGQ